MVYSYVCQLEFKKSEVRKIFILFLFFGKHGWRQNLYKKVELE